jgi:endonuclease/exonuclease/phosphatase family metal-dependent hydrolase
MQILTFKFELIKIHSRCREHCNYYRIQKLEKMTNKITIYNHNIRWSNSKKQHLEIAKKIENLQPDIVCLQEVAFEKQANLFRLKGYSLYYSTLERSAMVVLTAFIKPFFNLYKKIEYRKFVDYNQSKKVNLPSRMKTLSIFFKSGKKLPRNSNFLKGYLLVLVKEQPVKVTYKQFNEQGGIFKNIAERVAKKGFIKVEFKDFDIFTTHLLSSHKKNKVELDTNNTKQLKQFLSASKSIKKTIIIGDLNFGPESNKYFLTKELNDLTKDLPITEYIWKTRLDYIFTNFQPEYYSCSIVQFDQQPSDHYGIWCEMEF